MSFRTSWEINSTSYFGHLLAKFFDIESVMTSSELCRRISINSGFKSVNNSPTDRNLPAKLSIDCTYLNRRLLPIALHILNRNRIACTTPTKTKVSGSCVSIRIQSVLIKWESTFPQFTSSSSSIMLARTSFSCRVSL